MQVGRSLHQTVKALPGIAEQAASWYRRAAEAGHTGAQCNLGACYYHGAGVAKDAEHAASWFRRAAEAGHADAHSAWVIFTLVVTVLPRMQSTQRRGSAMLLRRAMLMLNASWAIAILMVTVSPRMQSGQRRGTSVQLRRATQSLNSTWVYAILMVAV